MASIVLPQSRRTQPQGAVRLDPANKLSQKLATTFLGTGALVDGMDHYFTPRSSPVKIPFSEGIACSEAATPNGTFVLGGMWNSESDFSFVGYFAPDKVASEHVRMWNYNGAQYTAIVGSESSGNVTWRDAAIGTTVVGNHGGRPFSVGVTVSSAGLKVYFNGAHVLTTAITGFGGANENRLRRAGAFLMWRQRVLTDADFQSLHINPWQVFSADPQRIWFDSSVSAGPVIPQSNAALFWAFP